MALSRVERFDRDIGQRLFGFEDAAFAEQALDPVHWRLLVGAAALQRIRSLYTTALRGATAGEQGHDKKKREGGCPSGRGNHA